MASVPESIARILVGRRLSNKEYEQRKIGVFEAVPAIGLDGLGSASYGPEAAMTVLAVLGGAATGLVTTIMGPVVILLVVLYASYRQTIAAYPNNGGAYVVARENLGSGPALAAAAALMIDYVLNVAVGVSAGVGALISIIPALQPYVVPLCLVVLAVVTLANLRGTTEAGRLFALPTYVFIPGLLAVIAVGALRTLASHGDPAAVTHPPPLPPATGGAVGLWLMLRAFAAGCTAMTGVEAVSNGVSAFKEPRIKRARLTLTLICGSLGLLLAGIALLAKPYGLGAMDQTKAGYQSVISQLIGAVLGRGVAYDVIMASVLAVLVLSANTSMVGFPRLCRLVAEHDYLPRAFAMAGRRLVYTAGILFLAAASALLLIVFRGVTDRLIPLFAVGAFLTFTFSQAGMVAHWRKAGGAKAMGHMAINALGAAATAIALVIIVSAKFLDGAWITVIALPATIGGLLAIRRYYERLEREIATDASLPTSGLDPPIILVPLRGWNAPVAHALSCAMRLSPDVIGVHLTEVAGPDESEDPRSLEEAWSRHVDSPCRTSARPAPTLEIAAAPYRDMHQRLIELAAQQKADHPGRRIAVMIPDLLKTRWWQPLFHGGTAHALRERLLHEGDPDLMVMSAPWRIGQAIA